MVPALGQGACKKALAGRPSAGCLGTLVWNIAIWCGEPCGKKPQRSATEISLTLGSSQQAMARFTWSKTWRATEACHGKNASPFPHTAVFRDTVGFADHA